jgi:hypothetical protein
MPGAVLRGGVVGTRIPQQPTGQLGQIWKNPRWFENWLRGNASLSRIDSPLTHAEARTVIQNAQQLNLRVDLNPMGLAGKEVTGHWGN